MHITPSNPERLQQVRERRHFSSCLEELDQAASRCARQRPAVSSEQLVADNWNYLQALCQELREGLKLLKKSL